jgi:ATP-binding cassette subfamily B protein
MRMFDPDTGSVNIDGHDIKDVTIASLRERISYVGQDAFLFAGTVKYNIGLGKNGATELDIIRASKAANAHDFIMALPNGYDTDVGENGSNLSGGQKQRLTIARAFLRDSEILILDEATSALDSEAEVAVKQAVEKLSQGRTTIVIAHRLSTVASADHIIVMKDGEVAEQGKPAELLKQNGLYRRLYQHQFLPEAG